MSITVKTDVKVREDNTSESQADAMCTMILLNDIRRNMTEKREQMLEEGIVQLPVLTPIEGGVAVQTTSTNSVDETKEEKPLDEEDLSDIAYAEAMIAAMSAMGKNLSETIDMSSERSVLLKKLSDASIKMAQNNLEESIKEIREMDRAERKARRAERRGLFTSRLTNGFMMAMGAFMCCNPLTATAGAMMIATSAAMLTMDETGTTEDAINGISKGLVLAGMDENDAAITGSIGFAFGTIAVGGGLTCAASKVATFTAQGATRAASGAARATAAANNAGQMTTEAIMNGTDLAVAARKVATFTGEAADGATKAAVGTRQAATTARTAADAADAAVEAAGKAISPAQKATLLKAADEAKTAAAVADDAATVAENTAKSATDIAEQAYKTANAFAKGTVSKADLFTSMKGAVKAAEDASKAAGLAAKAADGADRASTVVTLASMSESGAEAAQNAMDLKKKLPPTYNTGIDSAIETSLSSPATRGCFTNLSKVAGHKNAANIIHSMSAFTNDIIKKITYVTIGLTLIEAGFAAAGAAYKIEGAQIRRDAADTQEDKSLIMAASDAIDDQTARESEFLAQMQKALSDAIGSLKPQLAKQWRPVTNAIQG